MSVPKFYIIKDPSSFLEKLKKRLSVFFDKTILIVVFGSVAKNKIRLYSDLDLLVVTKNNEKKKVKKEMEQILFDFLEQHGFYTFDLLVLDENEFNKKKNVLVIREALTDGIVLWKLDQTLK